LPRIGYVRKLAPDNLKPKKSRLAAAQMLTLYEATLAEVK